MHLSRAIRIGVTSVLLGADAPPSPPSMDAYRDLSMVAGFFELPKEDPPTKKDKESGKSEKFSDLLREELKSEHAATRKSTFATVLASGEMTKDQWISHLQQRATILRAIDKAAKSFQGNAVVETFYGKDERAILAYLESDLDEVLGAKKQDGWKELPSTKALREVIEGYSKKDDTSSPYPLIGVLYNLTAGTQRGGRFIGGQAKKQWSLAAQHYLRSEGLDRFTDKLDEISQEKHRKEVIDGARGAYKHILPLNNEGIFRGPGK